MRALNGTVSDNSLNIVDAEDTKVINIGKTLVANAITEKGVAADKNDSFATLSKKIDKISQPQASGPIIVFKNSTNTLQITPEVTVNILSVTVS